MLRGRLHLFIQNFPLFKVRIDKQELFGMPKMLGQPASG
jgi:hypothetical protein